MPTTTSAEPSGASNRAGPLESTSVTRAQVRRVVERGCPRSHRRRRRLVPPPDPALRSLAGSPPSTSMHPGEVFGQPDLQVDEEMKPNRKYRPPSRRRPSGITGRDPEHRPGPRCQRDATPTVGEADRRRGISPGSSTGSRRPAPMSSRVHRQLHGPVAGVQREDDPRGPRRRSRAIADASVPMAVVAPWRSGP